MIEVNYCADCGAVEALPRHEGLTSLFTEVVVELQIEDADGTPTMSIRLCQLCHHWYKYAEPHPHFS